MTRYRFYGCVIQLGEICSYKAEVAGSSPAVSTRSIQQKVECGPRRKMLVD